MTLYCRYCGNTDLVYRGVDDGGGDYGDQLVDIYYCPHCDMDVEVTGFYREVFDTDREDDKGGDAA